MRILLSLLLMVVAAGCAVMPASGPQSWDVWAGQHDPKNLPYAFVRITPKVADVLGKAVPRLVGEFPPDRRRPKDIVFGIGDIVGVTIFEASSGGLFIPAEAGVRPGNFITIPPQAVDVHGNISVPYAGAIRARGRTQVEVQQAIVDALKDRAIEPQAIVSIVDQRTSLINVISEGVARRIPAQLAPERLLDAISRAGGPGGPGPDMWVLLERNSRRGLAPFGALIYEPDNNIYVHAGDTIYLYREPQTYLTFGALGSQQQIPFGAWRITLAEAVGKAGGLRDDAADPASVFLYRGETRDVAEAIGIDATKFQGPIIPVIYNIDFRNPASYFLATTFEMRNKDVIYVSNSVSTEATKFLTYVRTVNSTLNDPINYAITGYALRNIIKTPITTTTTSVFTGSAPVISAPAP